MGRLGRGHLSIRGLGSRGRLSDWSCLRMCVLGCGEGCSLVGGFLVEIDGPYDCPDPADDEEGGEDLDDADDDGDTVAFGC